MFASRAWRVSAIAVAGLGLATADAAAHEIKVLLDRLSVQPGDEDQVFLSWGHRLPTDGPTRGADIDRYVLVTPSGSVQYLATDEESDQRNVVHLEERGLYTVGAVRKPAVLTVFTLGDQHVHFVGPKDEVQPGARIDDSFRSYQFAKALALAGEEAETTRPLGHDLEIVPTGGPSGWVVGRDIEFRVLFEGREASGKLFQAKPLDFKPDDVWTWTRPTDQEGHVVLRPDRPGTWLLKVTAERPSPPEEREHFDADHWTATLVLEVRDAG
jgi:uncharacterized GH25 family protein